MGESQNDKKANKDQMDRSLDEGVSEVRLSIPNAVRRLFFFSNEIVDMVLTRHQTQNTPHSICEQPTANIPNLGAKSNRHKNPLGCLKRSGLSSKWLKWQRAKVKDGFSLRNSSSSTSELPIASTTLGTAISGGQTSAEDRLLYFSFPEPSFSDESRYKKWLREKIRRGIMHKPLDGGFHADSYFDPCPFAPREEGTSDPPIPRLLPQEQPSPLSTKAKQKSRKCSIRKAVKSFILNGLSVMSNYPVIHI